MQSGMSHAARGPDPYALEHMSKPSFWILGLFLGIVWGFFIWDAGAILPATDASGDQGSSVDDSGGSQVAELNATPKKKCGSGSPRLTLWLAPALISRGSYVIATGVYLLVLGAALLESYWFLVSFSRMTAGMARGLLYLPGSPPLWARGVCALSFGVWLVFDLFAICVTAVLVVPLVICVIELACCTYQVDEAPGLAREKVKS
ncbi:hypothetical protein VMCG_09999 [Cytospora schulzeri]|uniref:Transmembrane protein n=1 Tax=Cytospora schulzeri TaxID=448051 RepID=A0A423VIV9_9PEZI|nr:hypothetical protein VMCG_09999 [Valsa malicola]